MAQGHHLHLRLFLEGIEVPVVSAQVGMAANAPATAVIQVVATDKILDLLPRTVVHLFFYDYIDATHTVQDSGENRDTFNSAYKLLFMGEIAQIQFQKTPNSRAVVLQCMDFSNYWDTTYQYNFNGSLFGGRRQAAFIGANSDFFTSPLGHGVGTISRLLSGRSVNFPDLRGLLAGIVRMLEAIGGSYYGRNTFKGCNDFTSIAELRLKILQQITAAEKDTSTAQLFARKAFSMWMNRQTQSLGQLVTFRGLLQMMFKFIFHECYPCTCPKFVPEGTRKEARQTSVPLGSISKFKTFVDKTNTALNLVIIAHDNLRWWRDGVNSVAVDDVSSTRATQYVTSWAAADKSVNELYAQGSALGVPKSVVAELTDAHQSMRKIKNLSLNGGSTISANWKNQRGERSGTLDKNYTQIFPLYQNIMAALRKILGKKETKRSSVTLATGSRINNQLFRPDLYFAAPPRCNVLFPESYDSFSFSRNFMREVSRIELQTHNEILGNDALFNGRYYAPNVEDVRRGAKLSSRAFARTIMEHELYTGIIPMFENMSEVNLFAMRSGQVSKSGAKVAYAQRAVNYQYFKYRFDSRTMSASGRFNPMFVPGFPSLIIDKHLSEDKMVLSTRPVNEIGQALNLTVDEETTVGDVLRELVSPQYLGVCASLNHSVTQGGGNTSYSFMQARIHRESTEFLGIDKADVFKVIGDGREKTVIAGFIVAPPKKGQVGPKGGTITSVRDLSKNKKYKGRYLQMPSQKAKYRVGNSYPLYLFDGINVQHDVNDVLEIGAYEVTEGYVKRKKQKVDLPIEEAICPPWIWDGWRVPKISETYDQFFGTGAITDIAGYTMQPDDQEASEAEGRVKASSPGQPSPASGTDPRSQAVVEAGMNQIALLNQDKERTVENSIDFLVRSYSFIKVNNLDIGDFLKAYSWRPVATFPEIMGGENLQIKEVYTVKNKVVKARYLKSKEKFVIIPLVDEVGNDAGTRKEVLAKAKYGYRYVTRPTRVRTFKSEGLEGFHSRAFGDVEDLFGLVNPAVSQVLKLSSEQRKVAARLDVRKRRREVIRAYVAELTHSKGLIG